MILRFMEKIIGPDGNTGAQNASKPCTSIKYHSKILSRFLRIFALKFQESSAVMTYNFFMNTNCYADSESVEKHLKKMPTKKLFTKSEK